MRGSVGSGGGRRAQAATQRPRQPHQKDQAEEQQPRHIEDVVRGEHERLGVDQSIEQRVALIRAHADRKSTRLNSSHSQISYAVFCLKKKKKNTRVTLAPSLSA